MSYKYKRSLVGGTFDRFHSGHKKLLITAFNNSEKIIIGIATDDLFKNKRYSQVIEDYSVREKTVVDFLIHNGFSNRFNIVPIHDFYGTSLTDKDLDAIFITESNTDAIIKINEERIIRSYKPLETIIVPYVLGNDNGIISSERIRNGEIDRQGNNYANLFRTKNHYEMPDDVRDDLRNPIGIVKKEMADVISGLKDSSILIGVGDIVVTTAAKIGRQPDISIIDGRTRRHKLTSNDGHGLYQLEGVKLDVENPAGLITQKAALMILKAINNFGTTQKKQQLVVHGEEDLLAIPAILFSPLQSVVLYGQFDKGIVIVEVSEQNKKRVYDLFGKFQ